MSESETFSSEEWSVIESALFRYQRRIEDMLTYEGQTRSNLLDLIKRTDRKVTRLRDNAHGRGVQATPETPRQSVVPPKNEGRWGQSGPGSDDYFSMAD